MENDLLKSVGVASDPFDIGQIPIYSILSIGHGMNCIPTTSMPKLFVCPSSLNKTRIDSHDAFWSTVKCQDDNINGTIQLFYEPRAKRNFVYVITTF